MDLKAENWVTLLNSWEICCLFCVMLWWLVSYNTRRAFLSRTDFYYVVQSHQLCLTAQQCSFHTAQHRRLPRVFEIRSFMFFLCPSRSLPPAPASWPASAGTSVRKSRSKWRSQGENEIQGVSGRNRVKYGQQMSTAWFAAGVKCCWKDLWRFWGRMSQGLCSETCVLVPWGRVIMESIKREMVAGFPSEEYRFQGWDKG